MTHYRVVSILHHLQVKSVCILLLLCVPLCMMNIPEPCRHSITKDHLLQIKRLINNQLWNGCTITYLFIERKNLSTLCYVKAALPQVLDLLSSHFRYGKGSESALSVISLQKVIFNVYLQHCVPTLNEELEEAPVEFLKQFTDSPVRALQRVEEVLEIYLQLITQTDTSLDWSCAGEYSNYSATTDTELVTSTVAVQGLLGENRQSTSDTSFYRLGFIVLAVCTGIVLILTASCFIHTKRHQPQRWTTYSDRPDATPLSFHRYPLNI